MAEKKRETMTSATGIPLADNQNALTAGERGPLLVQNWPLFEKHAHFSRERIVQTKGTPTAPSPSPTMLRCIPKPIATMGAEVFLSN